MTMINKEYDDLVASLQEAVAYAKGLPSKIRVSRVQVVPIKVYSKETIRMIRAKTGMSQAVFAKALGVSAKTVEAWEAGASKPNGPSSRLLTFFEKDANFAIREELIAVR